MQRNVVILAGYAALLLVVLLSSCSGDIETSYAVQCRDRSDNVTYDSGWMQHKPTNFPAVSNRWWYQGNVLHEQAPDEFCGVVIHKRRRTP